MSLQMDYRSHKRLVGAEQMFGYQSEAITVAKQALRYVRYIGLWYKRG